MNLFTKINTHTHTHTHNTIRRIISVDVVTSISGIELTLYECCILNLNVCNATQTFLLTTEEWTCRSVYLPTPEIDVPVLPARYLLSVCYQLLRKTDMHTTCAIRKDLHHIDKLPVDWQLTGTTVNVCWNKHSQFLFVQNTFLLRLVLQFSRINK